LLNGYLTLRSRVKDTATNLPNNAGAGYGKALNQEGPTMLRTIFAVVAVALLSAIGADAAPKSQGPSGTVFLGFTPPEILFLGVQVDPFFVRDMCRTEFQDDTARLCTPNELVRLSPAAPANQTWVDWPQAGEPCLVRMYYPVGAVFDFCKGSASDPASVACCVDR
jgi:hypothetical protein